jgi:hypothetical protein
MKQRVTEKFHIALKWTLGGNEFAQAVSQFRIADFYTV